MNRYKTLFFHIVGAAIGGLLALSSCGRQAMVDAGPHTERADSLMEAAHLAHDSDRILFLADSLEAVGDFSRIKADYWRGYGYYSKWNHHLCQEYWYEAIALEAQDREDIAFAGRSANRLSDVLLTRGDYEAAMRVAAPAIEKLREEDMSVSRDYGYLLVTVGCCELYNRNREQAEAYFEDAYKIFMLLIDDNGIDGGSSHEDNLKSAVAGLTTAARHCLDKKMYVQTLVWVDRLDAVMEEYSRQPETLPESIDRRQTLSRIFRATALEGLGSHEAAAAIYEETLSNPFSSTTQGRMEAAKYLMQAGRWEEAAEYYKQLNSIASVYSARLTLDNIQTYMLPKFRANFYARQNDEALATAIRLCDALDSAIIWNREDKAAELTTLFHTQEIKQEFVQQQADMERLRFVAAVVVIALLVVSFLLFVILRQRSALRLEEAYQALEKAHDQAQQASRVKTAFLQQISHEIRTPINLLSGFAQLLTTPGIELDEKSKEEINNGVVENTGRITGLVSKILELSDLISKTELERSDRISAGQIASMAADQCGIRSAEGIQFGIQGVDAVQNQELLTNAQAAMRILALLLENAVKYTGKGAVSLRLVNKDGFLYFLVEDTGIGVPPEEAEHIFEHFVQLDEYQEGTGIGLSLARSLARRLGGEVVLDTSYSFGARFVFSLPLNNGE